MFFKIKQMSLTKLYVLNKKLYSEKLKSNYKYIYRILEKYYYIFKYKFK